jgi:hypothetical protein
MPYTVPHTIASGELVTTTTMNNEWGGNVSFLANPPACRVYRAAAQSIPDAAVTTVTFDSERYDTNTMHDPVTNNSRITINTAGLYIVGFSWELASAGDYLVVADVILLNGTTSIASTLRRESTSVGAPRAVTTTVYKFAAGNYIEAQIFHDNSANAARNLNASGNYSPEFWATWIGLG